MKHPHVLANDAVPGCVIVCVSVGGWHAGPTVSHLTPPHPLPAAPAHTRTLEIIHHQAGIWNGSSLSGFSTHARGINVRPVQYFHESVPPVLLHCWSARVDSISRASPVRATPYPFPYDCLLALSTASEGGVMTFCITCRDSFLSPAVLTEIELSFFTLLQNKLSMRERKNKLLFCIP